ncbi:putative nuclease HARBI1 [Ostrinia nubilalis]|uniref:putative nuclease HARBI1 n=1 Tax=Ostrinia nubilalis TaxID=29057 RepID=UPI00308255A1
MAVMRGFMDVFGFPGVVGCIDGTNIAIIRPHDYEEAFFNRKHYHSLNAMIICDADLNVLHVDASYGGASHDSHVWNRSALEAHMRSLTEAGEVCWLLEDSGYWIRPAGVADDSYSASSSGFSRSTLHRSSL